MYYHLSPSRTSPNRFIGGHSEEDPPVPIPNTEVKLFSADGTAWVTVWESRSSPIFFANPLLSLAQQGVSSFISFSSFILPLAGPLFPRLIASRFA